MVLCLCQRVLYPSAPELSVSRRGHSVTFDSPRTVGVEMQAFRFQPRVGVERGLSQTITLVCLLILWSRRIGKPKLGGRKVEGEQQDYELNSPDYPDSAASSKSPLMKAVADTQVGSCKCVGSWRPKAFRVGTGLLLGLARWKRCEKQRCAYK